MHVDMFAKSRESRGVHESVSWVMSRTRHACVQAKMFCRRAPANNIYKLEVRRFWEIERTCNIAGFTFTYSTTRVLLLTGVC